jgi:glycosyltransferase involved in cell wall biosynthesis
VAVGNSVRQALINNEGLHPQWVGVVYNGVRTPSEAFERSAVRTELGVGDGDFVVVQVARLDPIKDHKTAIHAIVAAARRVPRMRFFIIGEGPQRVTIEKELRTLSVNGQVTLLGLRHDVPRLLAAADAFLLTSVSEGIPVTVLEAMAAGVPVVATRVGGLPELVTDGKTGFLAAPGDTIGLADALVRLAKDSKLRARFSAGGIQTFELQFTEQKMIDSYDRLYQNMLRRCANVPSPSAF